MGGPFGSGYFSCMRASSGGSFALLITYIYAFLVGVLLVNMLIAIMAKTVDEMYESVLMVYAEASAKMVLAYDSTPMVPPPINLLSIPYYILVAMRRAACCKYRCYEEEDEEP